MQFRSGRLRILSLDQGRWRVGLGDLSGGAFYSESNPASGDGSILLGSGTTVAGSEALIRDSSNGIRSAKDMLVSDYGLNFTGWTLFAANNVTPDGTTFVGNGYNPDGHLEGWIAHIPEPSSLSLLVGAGLFSRIFGGCQRVIPSSS